MYAIRRTHGSLSVRIPMLRQAEKMANKSPTYTRRDSEVSLILMHIAELATCLKESSTFDLRTVNSEILYDEMLRQWKKKLYLGI